MATAEANLWSEEELKARAEPRRWIIKLIPLAILFMATFPYMVLNNIIILTPSTISATHLKDYPSKLQFTFKYFILGVVWLVFCMWNVISKRFPSPAVNPTGGYEHLTEEAKNILTNSLEQFIMNIIVQLSLISYLDEQETLKTIPLLNILFIIGRITFFLGYPKYRAFGFWVTMWPMQIAMWITLNKFLQFYSCDSQLMTWGIPLAFYGYFYLKMKKHRYEKF